MYLWAGRAPFHLFCSLPDPWCYARWHQVILFEVSGKSQMFLEEDTFNFWDFECLNEDKQSVSLHKMWRKLYGKLVASGSWGISTKNENNTEIFSLYHLWHNHIGYCMEKHSFRWQRDYVFNLMSLPFRIKLSATPANLAKMWKLQNFTYKSASKVCQLKKAVKKQPELSCKQPLLLWNCRSK